MSSGVSEWVSEWALSKQAIKWVQQITRAKQAEWSKGMSERSKQTSKQANERPNEQLAQYSMRLVYFLIVGPW